MKFRDALAVLVSVTAALAGPLVVRAQCNPIDAFVRQRLAAEGLVPSPPAERVVLLRRVTLDLTGLPPTPAEIDEYLSDTSPDAYERRVDRLLASSAFGERWARHWLDLARFADSHGFQRDDLRDIWHYRDWVIQAMNADMPFDRFTIEQIAGDLLPRATDMQRIATGFHRCNTINVEAGSDPEESRVNQILDRVNTTATVWLGVTLECAQCHDHKHDPFTQVDYYRFYAFFNNTPAEAERSHPNALGSIKFRGSNMAVGGTSTLVMDELPFQRRSFVFKRGDFRSPGQNVRPGIPDSLPPLRETIANRLTLANWLVSRENPLTARVVVNRWWAELFGEGIVATPEDFGSRGDLPTHPELLDWLAVEFMDRGWSMKHIIRLMVTSSTYRQSSRVTPQLRERDPMNKWLARGPRFRMDAEMIRDNAFAISGILYRKMAGMPCAPPQPNGLWMKIAGEKLNYIVSPVPERNRRGVYVIWKRASPYPSMANFDANSRLTCTVKRMRSNTPMQSLTLLNDPVYSEAAQAFASLIESELPKATLDQQIRFGFRRCVAREPTPIELGILRELHAKQKAAASTLTPMQAVATALLNLDETITKP